MNIDINTPEIKILLRQVELKASLTPRLVSDFDILAERISSAGERLSQSTLERLWQYSTRRKNTVSQHTLDVLAHYIGHADWDVFRQTIHHSAHPESGYFTDGIMDVDALTIGSRLCLTWLPDREIEAIYLGNRRFEVAESRNSSLRRGDTFECTQIQLRQPLYLDRFRRAGEGDNGTNARYVVGRDNGILSVQILDGEKT